MKKSIQKLITIGGVTLLVLGLAACSNPKSETGSNVVETKNQTATKVNQNDAETEKIKESQSEDDNQILADQNKSGSQELSGTITMAGSTSMEKLANALAEAFMEKYPQVTVTAEFTGSSAGIEAVLAGNVDLGNASRNLKDSEAEAGVVGNIVAIDGIAVVVNPSNDIARLTKDELIAIYTGTVTNWSELDGSDEPIVVVGREAGSGTRGAFEELLEVEDECTYALELDSTGTVVAKVAATAGGIGYVSLDMVDDTVTAVDLEGVAATAENIIAGNYLLSRPFVMATVGTVDQQSELVQAFFADIYSEAGSELVESIGLIAVEQ